MFDRALNERNLERTLGFRQHPRTDVQTKHGLRVPRDLHRLACQQSGAGGDVKDVHARTQAGALQTPAPVPVA